jgi:hypothetical protein
MHLQILPQSSILRNLREKGVCRMRKQLSLVEVVLPEKKDEDGNVTRGEKVLYRDAALAERTVAELKRDNILARPEVQETLKAVEDRAELKVGVFVVPFRHAE